MSNIEKSIKLKAELDALRPLKKEDEMRIMQKFRLDWNYHSNHLEGNTLTYGETKALILFGITAQGKPLKDHFEITGHDEAIKWVIDIVKQKRPLTENFIRELHKLILKEPYEIDAITPDGQPTKKRVNIGEYKTSPNHVKTKTGEIFRFATPEETPALMNDLIVWFRNQSENEEPNSILIAAVFHYRFIRIHPFDDGNGRTARILMNFILMQHGYPPVIIKTEDKENYFAALRQADAGQIAPFFEYIAQNLAHSHRKL
ncbi:MAG: Fic family protein [Bacteroidia bacterium]